MTALMRDEENMEKEHISIKSQLLIEAEEGDGVTGLGHQRKLKDG